MPNKKSGQVDVAVVGGGPAGISACLEFSKLPRMKTVLFESEAELGGIPRTCHYFFGLRDRKRIYTGPAYARALDNLIRRTSVEIYTNSTVINIIPGKPGELHRINVLSPQGLNSYECNFVLLATGCFESSCSARTIPGARPAGIFTTEAIQHLIRIHHQKPGGKALIIGSEHVALSSVLTLRSGGISIAGIVEEDEEIQTYPSFAKVMSFFFRIPIYKSTSVKAILGDKRVKGVELVNEVEKKDFLVECDTVVITGKFRSYSPLIDNTSIKRDSLTFGPIVDMNLMTSVQNIFAAGNILRGGNMHDLCALEGKWAAKNILEKLELCKSATDEYISITAESPIRYVVPQRVILNKIKSPRFAWFYPWFSIQVEHTLKNSILEAWSGDEKIWERSFSKLIANNRVPLPIQKFNWNKVNKENGITLKLKPD